MEGKSESRPVTPPRWRVGEAHKNNCCAIHGCKWSEKDCPVVLKTARGGPCRICLDIEDKPPTKWAYEAACKALWKHRENEESLTKANQALEEENAELKKKLRALRKQAKRREIGQKRRAWDP